MSVLNIVVFAGSSLRCLEERIEKGNQMRERK